MTDRFKFRVYIKYAEMMCYDVNCFYIDRIKNKITIHFDDHTKTFKFDDVVLEQCTGLKDKNGKLIYEGDIIREISKKEPEWEEYVTEVKWKVCGFNIYDASDFYFEVIGNIHENKELLDD
jgi:uncharacterized phage protein (TIGR01671 family)